MRTSFHFTRYACGPASPAQVSPVRVMEMAYLAADLGGSGPIVLPSGGFHFQDLRAPRNFLATRCHAHHRSLLSRNAYPYPR